MRPLRIVARLECGVIDDLALGLDGILFAAAMRERYGPELVQMPGQYSVPEIDRRVLPLAIRHADHFLWYYAASAAQWPVETAEGASHWVKQFDSRLIELLDATRLPRRLNRESGRYRGYRMPTFYRHALEVKWYVVGDAYSIRRLLAPITHIGKKRTQGWGSVSQWTVEEWPEDWSVCRDGVLMRPVPGKTGIYCGFRPSYWLRSNQTICQLPGHKAECGTLI